MRTFIVFTQVTNTNNNNIYPNLVEAETFSDAVDKVLKGRSHHEAIALSGRGYVYAESHGVDFQMFDAVTKLIPPGGWTLGEYVEADTK